MIQQKEVKTNIGEVKTSTFFKPIVGKYCVYYTEKGAIVYRVVGSQGAGKDYSLTLESDGRQERFGVKGEEIKKLEVIIYPTGYIKC